MATKRFCYARGLPAIVHFNDGCEMTSRQFGVVWYSAPFNRNKCSLFSYILHCLKKEEKKKKEKKTETKKRKIEISNTRLQICLSVLWYKHPEQSATRNALFLATLGLENMNERSHDLLDTVTFSPSIIPFLLCNFNLLNYVLNVFWYYERKCHELWNDSCWQTL